MSGRLAATDITLACPRCDGRGEVGRDECPRCVGSAVRGCSVCDEPGCIVEGWVVWCADHAPEKKKQVVT